MLRELAELIDKPLFTIHHWFWSIGEVPEDLRFASVTSIYKKDSKEDLENYMPVSLTLVPRNVVEQVILCESHGMCGTMGDQAQPA